MEEVRETGLIPGLAKSPGGGHGNPLQYSCPENPMDRGAWQATVHRIAKSQTQLKWHSTHTHTHTHTHRTSVSQGVICQVLCALAWWSRRRYWHGASTGPCFWVTMMLIGRTPTNLNGPLTTSKKHTFAGCIKPPHSPGLSANDTHSSLPCLIQWKLWYLNPGSLPSGSVL